MIQSHLSKSESNMKKIHILCLYSSCQQFLQSVSLLLFLGIYLLYNNIKLFVLHKKYSMVYKAFEYLVILLFLQKVSNKHLFGLKLSYCFYNLYTHLLIIQRHVFFLSGPSHSLHSKYHSVTVKFPGTITVIAIV